MITDQVLRLWIGCDRALQEDLDEWQAFGNIKEARVVSGRGGREVTVEQRESFTVEGESVEV